MIFSLSSPWFGEVRQGLPKALTSGDVPHWSSPDLRSSTSQCVDRRFDSDRWLRNPRSLTWYAVSVVFTAHRETPQIRGDGTRGHNRAGNARGRTRFRLGALGSVSCRGVVMASPESFEGDGQPSRWSIRDPVAEARRSSWPADPTGVMVEAHWSGIMGCSAGGGCFSRATVLLIGLRSLVGGGVSRGSACRVRWQVAWR